MAKENDGSFWHCMAPTLTGGGAAASAGWTICVPQPWSAALWVLAAVLFVYTCRAFIVIGGSK